MSRIERKSEQGDFQLEGTSVSVTRRRALGRFAQYTAPTMLAILASEHAVRASCFERDWRRE
jgi:hypothetical protein